MRRWIPVPALGLWFVVVVSIPAHAQATTSAPSPAKPVPAVGTVATPTADQILDTYVKAIGGREAWKKLTSRVTIGTIEMHEKAPNQLVARITINGASFSQGFDGTVGWADDPQNGLREQTGTELTETKRDADFYHPLDLRQLYSKFTATGIEKINDRDMYVIEAVTSDGETDKMYFDVETGLVGRIVGHHHSPEGVSEFTEDLGDYREVDGIKLPFSVQQSSADSAFTIKFAEVHHNVPIDNSEFSKPAAQ
jgi:hypothetical protein